MQLKRLANKIEIEPHTDFDKELNTIQKEINIHRNLDHPNIIKLIDYFYVY